MSAITRSYLAFVPQHTPDAHSVLALINGGDGPEAETPGQPAGEPRRRLPTTVLGNEGSEYLPMHPTLVVEAEAEATVMTFTARLRPRIHRFRTNLTRRPQHRHATEYRVTTKSTSVVRPCASRSPRSPPFGAPATSPGC